jgi:hypothetical protein
MDHFLGIRTTYYFSGSYFFVLVLLPVIAARVRFKIID